jgi:hypothetical protein
MAKKREISIFDAIEELETQDRRAEGKRQKRNQSDRQKAKEVQFQTTIFNHLVEARILMQRAVVAVNDKEDDKTMAAPAVPSKDFRETCNLLLEKLLVARSQLAGEKDAPEAKYKEILTSSSSKELHRTLQDEYNEHKEQWKQIFNQRHKSLRLQSGVTAKSQFKVMDSSFWEQVESTVEYEEIRQRNNPKANNHNAASFDDSKVYQQLLKDFVATSAHFAEDAGAAVVAQRLKAAQRNQKSEKTNVDRRASKGRKIRYKEIPKLVNFTFPLSRPNLSSLNQDEYFHSLFGGASKATN